ncbi:MAG TPA: serine protease [Stellaceae bacterium]|nr:serine protease [Stellaceae bacterium]
MAPAVLVALAGCSSDEKPPAPIQHAPPVAFNVPTGRIAVAPATVDLLPGRGIGTEYRNVDCWVRMRSVMPTDFPSGDIVSAEISRALGEARLTVSAAASADVASAGGADYLLVPSVPSAHADSCVDSLLNDVPADVDAQVAVSWHLWSVRDKRVVYESTTTGTARLQDPTWTITAAAKAAIDDATRQLLQTTAVQQYLTYGHVIAAPAVAAAAPAGPPVPAGGAAPIPQPPAGFQPGPASVAETLPPILVPVKTGRPAGTPIDAAAARRVTLSVGDNAAAIVLGDGYLLTSSAAIGDGLSVGVSLGKGQIVDARVLRRDAAVGVALLRTDANLPAALPLQPRRNTAGDPVWGVGSAGLVKGSFTSAKSVALPGALAGGPVLDASGNVIGVLLPDGGFASMGTVFRALQLGAQLSEE